MSAGDKLAAEAQAFLAAKDSDYRVELRHAGSLDWVYVLVFYREQLIFRLSVVRSFRYARWRVRRSVRQHRRFLKAMEREGIAS